MRTESLLVPGAILAGCGLISLGVYFGIRSLGTAPPGTSAGSAVTAASPPAHGTASAAAAPREDPPAAAPSTRAASPAAASSPAASRQAAEQAVRDALLAEKKATFVPRCWQPAIAKAPEPATSRFVFDIAVDASGREIARGINDFRGESRGDVSQCLRDLPMGLQIAQAPGAPLTVSVEVTFP